MLYFNARSITNKQSELSNTLEHYDANIVGICETWLKDSVNLTAFDNKYHVFRNDRPTTLGVGGGSLLAISTKLQCKLVKKIAMNRCECIFVDVKLNQNHNVRYSLVYRPPDTNLFDSIELFDTIYENLKNSQMFVLFGDFNLPDISWENLVASSRISREFLTLCFKIGAEQRVNFPTRNENVLDLVLCSTRMLISSVLCEPPFCCSDHSSILCHLTDYYCASQEAPLKPCFKKADYEMINAFLATIDWDEVYAHCITANDYWQAFQNILNTAVYNYVPFVSSVKHRHSPWFNNDIKRLHSDKQKKWKRYVQSRNIVTHAQYKASANNFRREFLRSKCDYEKKLFSNNNTTGKLFGYVKSQTSVNYSIPCINKNDGTATTTDYEKCCEFLKYFSSVYIQDDNVLPDFSTNCKGNLNSFTCNAGNIVKVVKKLKHNSASGPDGMNVYFIKKILAVIASPLCRLYNVSLCQGSLPDDWKVAYIIPVFKKGDPHEASQYRPISLTSVMSKILERIVREKLLEYILDNNILPREQHGFVPKKSTVSNLIECLNDWTLNFDNNLATNIVYLDYSKCFDKVCHNKLLHKMKTYGITGSAFNWLESFLVNRVQHVKINGSLSPAARVESGVPQGTVLGPILFLIYSADLPQVVSHCKLSMYADDTKVYKSIRNKEDCILLQEDLNNIAKWAETWQMVLNPDKTKLLAIGNSKVDFNYVLNGKVIETVNHINDIGVTVQSNLKFTIHCSNTVKKAYYVTRTIFNTFKFHEPMFYKKMYVCYVRPLLEYACQVWSPMLKCNIDRIEKVQQYYSRRICSRNMSYFDRLNFLNIESLEQRRIKSDLVLFFKLNLDKISIDISNNYSIVSRSRSHSKHLYVFYSRTDKRKLFWINRIVSNWNDLNESDVIVESVQSFKKKLNNIYYVGRGSIFC